MVSLGLMRAATLAFLLAFVATAPANPVQLTQVPSGDRVHMTYTSRGCFGSGLTWDFDLERESTGIRCGFSGRGRSIILTAAETKGLDKLLEFSRDIARGACTTRDFVTITVIPNGDVISREEYRDATCSTDDIKDVTSFGKLIGKVALRSQ